MAPSFSGRMARLKRLKNVRREQIGWIESARPDFFFNEIAVDGDLFAVRSRRSGTTALQDASITVYRRRAPDVFDGLVHIGRKSWPCLMPFVSKN